MKVRKVFGTETTDYLEGFQYTDSVLKFFPTAEGYFNVETGKYVYNYTDHLGNTRLSYAKNGARTEIIEESNYYPFGLKHEGYNVLTGNPAYKYKYNGHGSVRLRSSPIHGGHCKVGGNRSVGGEV